VKKIVYISVAVLVLAALLRFVNLNSLPVFADESIYIRWSQVMRAESTLRFLPLSDGKEPLFMWTVIPFLKIISDPLVAGRVVSGLCGLITTLGIGLAAYILFNNKRIAIFASVIWAVLPFAVFFDRLALADTMLTMFVVWTFIFSCLSLRLLRLDMAMLAGFTLGFAWLTKSPALFSFALIPTLLVFTGWWHQPLRKKLIAIGLILVSYIIGFGMYNILRLGPEFQMIASRNQDYVIPLSEVMKHPLDPFIPHLKDVLSFFLYLVTPLGFGLALLGLAEAGTFKHVRQRFVLAFWWLVPLLAQAFVAKVFTARYLLFTVPFAVILMAHGIWHIGDRTQKHFLALAGLGLQVILCLSFDFLLLTNPAAVPLPPNERSGYLETWTAGTGIRDVAYYLKNIPGQPHILVGSEGFFGTPFSALQMYLNNYSNIRIIGVGLDIHSVSQDLLNAVSDNQVYLVVNSSRFSGDPQKLGLQLIASYPKAAAYDGSQEYLLFFKLQRSKE
jgi:4-amino-4-deoxy-L-arabinose transferase-like glycosyltransferase